MAQNSPEEQFILAANDWDLERLYKDLADAKLKVAPHKREFTEVEKLHLRGLLCACSPSDIAKKLHKQEGGLRAELSSTVYTAVPAVMRYNKKRKYYVVVKANESIFGRSPRKNSGSTLGRKNVN